MCQYYKVRRRRDRMAVNHRLNRDTSSRAVIRLWATQRPHKREMLIDQERDMPRIQWSYMRMWTMLNFVHALILNNLQTPASYYVPTIRDVYYTLLPRIPFRSHKQSLLNTLTKGIVSSVTLRSIIR
jgi:hypothetical protein